MKTMKKNNKLQVMAWMLVTALALSLTVPTSAKAAELSTDELLDLIEDELSLYGGGGSNGSNFGKINCWIPGSSSESQASNKTWVEDKENEAVDSSGMLFNQRINHQSVK